MANPSLAWDRIPYYGWWSDAPGVPASGYIELVMTERIRRVDGRMIYPGGAKRQITIGDTSQQDPDIVAAVKAGMKARDQTAQGAAFNDGEWEARWTKNLQAAIFTYYWAADDPDITPHGVGDEGYHVMVKEVLTSGAGKSYPTQPLIAHLDLPIPGVNLADIEVPPGSPTNPPPIFAKGQPGGIPALSPEGKVLDAFGNVVGGASPEEVQEVLEQVVEQNPRIALPAGGQTGQVLGLTGPSTAGWVDAPEGGGGGPVDWDDLPAGAVQTLWWNGTAWPATRPTEREDIMIVFRGGTVAPVPPTCLPGKDAWFRAVPQ